ncbi:RES domain-containing protein [Paludicola sp. MB14-C6]|uniref:RES domain-containing protein n=1 Tax=Paludihabitans sp. MB14-C6 TaxID=3070656 RepID=UPI0027DAF12B|nr:RES domain-containing protein [Paludicola sp. MB14-C6]WMJ22671.1 RES domain-containing protein [Paludicola sp. MB14-C6]
MSIKDFILDLSKVNKSENVFSTPKHINEDSAYLSELSKIYNEIERVALQHHWACLINETKAIKRAVKQYYDGRIDLSLQLIGKIIKELKQVPYICTAFNNCCAFNNNIPINIRNYNNVSLYRARTGIPDNFEDISSMYHIPFNKREKVRSQRFSIPGFPCLYLGKSVYTCWMELSQPSDSEFYVSRVTVDDCIRIFNLSVNFYDLEKLCDALKSDTLEDVHSIYRGVTTEEFILNYTKLWILCLACSFKVKEANRQFKSDYIVPQLVMLALKRYHIPAIAYLGKTFCEDEPYHNFAKLNLNVAIIMDGKDTFIYKKNKCEFSELMKKIQLSYPINYSQFKNLKNFRSSEKGESDNAQDNPQCFVNHHIKIAGTYKSYDHTYFCEFERYIDIIQKKCTCEVKS